ncbi:hypothetical protein ACM55G_08050 [Flavobacterium sp. LB3P122]|uniref:hypothetical protein n=1 Tax=Flavobacterium algoriphilum TaxID=3398738 RepID=UPI003A87364C
MKKATLFLGILSILAIVSCKKKEHKPFPPQVETSNATTPSTPAVSREVKDSTSIKVGTDGVNVTTKDGATKTSVNVSGGEAKIEIKK